MSLRYTLRHLNEADCTTDNMKKFELAVAEDTGKVYLRYGDKVIEFTHAAADYAIVAADKAKAYAEQVENLVNNFNTNTDAIVATCQTYADSAKLSVDTCTNLVNSVNGIATTVATNVANDAISKLATVAKTGSYNDLKDKPINISTFTNDVGYATSDFVSTTISNVVNSAPETLNTLNELATALGDDPNFATTVTNQLANKLDKTGNAVSATKATQDGNGNVIADTYVSNANVGTKVNETINSETTKHTIVVTYEDNTTETIKIWGVNS